MVGILIVLLGGGPTMEVDNGNHDDDIGNEAFLQEEEDTKEAEPISVWIIRADVDMGIIPVIAPKTQ